MANSVDPDEMACYEPSHLDLHCLQRYLYWSVWMKQLNPLSLFTSLWTLMVSYQEPFVIYFKMYSAYTEMYHYLLYYDMYFMVQSLFIIPLETT